MSEEGDGFEVEQEDRPFGRPSLYDPSYCERVQVEMSKGYSLTAFAGIIGVCRDTLTEWVSKHPDFSLAVKKAKALRLLQWERASMKIARDGGTGGASTMVIFGLKNMGGDEWSEPEKIDAKINGSLQITRIVREIVDSKENS